MSVGAGSLYRNRELERERERAYSSDVSDLDWRFLRVFASSDTG